MDFYEVLREAYSCLLSTHEQLEHEYKAGRTTINKAGWEVICDINLVALRRASDLLLALESRLTECAAALDQALLPLISAVPSHLAAAIFNDPARQ